MFYGIHLGKFYEIRGFISFLFHLGFALAISASDFIFKSFKKLKLGKEDEIAFRAILFLIIFLNNFFLEMIA
ncbi:MAG: hypothetical protein N3A69_08970 [Leptospiraceae bacterium]|nr:hypothetical protein [Leptospiraceae bacterium]